MFLQHSPYLVSGFDGPTREEGYPREAQVLMHGEHLHSQQVGLTQVVDEAANVSEKSGIDTVYIFHLHHRDEPQSHEALWQHRRALSQADSSSQRISLTQGHTESEAPEMSLIMQLQL